MNNQIIIEIEKLLGIEISDQKHHLVDSNRYGGIEITVPKTLTELTIEENEIMREIITLAKKGIINSEKRDKMLEELRSLYKKMKQKADELPRYEKPKDIEYWKLQIREPSRKVEVDEILEQEKERRIR